MGGWQSAPVLCMLLLCSCRAELQSALKRRLLAAYDSHSIRPALFEAEARSTFRADYNCSTDTVAPPDEIEVQILVDKYEPLDMVQQTWGLGGFLRILWNDPRLRYNGTAAGGCTNQLLLDRREGMGIWMPIVYFEEAKQVTVPKESSEDGLASMISVSPNGDVFWSRQFQVTVFCRIYAGAGSGIYKLPFDEQTCPLVFGPYAEDASQLRVRWRDGHVGLDHWDGPCLGCVAGSPSLELQKSPLTVCGGCRLMSLLTQRYDGSSLACAASGR
jgi:hypothetical protein